VNEDEDGGKTANVGASADPEAEAEVEVDVGDAPFLAAGGFVIEVIQGVSQHCQLVLS